MSAVPTILSEPSLFLPSFEEAFSFTNLSMSSELHTNSLVNKRKNENRRPKRSAISLQQKEHPRPKRSAIKRHLEQEKVLVQPAQTDIHHVKKKKIPSDRDLLFFANTRCENLTDVQKICADNPLALPAPAIVPRQEDAQAKKKPGFLVRGREMKAFFQLLEDDLIDEFISRDRCMQITDKYLLAMVFVYFKRAGYKRKDYNKMNFFIALYLASDMEEDEEELKYEIFPWALGDTWRDRFPKFLKKRDKLWASIDHQAVVSRRCCEEIFAIQPDHPIWKRNRPEYHGGAVRSYMKDPNDDGYPRGPKSSPRRCPECMPDSQYDSASPDSVSWYVSSGDSSPGNTTEEFFEKSLQSSFDMKGLKQTLQEGTWPQAEE